MDPAKRRNATLVVRLKAEEKGAIEEAAEEQGISTAQWVRDALLQALAAQRWRPR